MENSQNKTIKETENLTNKTEDLTNKTGKEDELLKEVKGIKEFLIDGKGNKEQPKSQRKDKEEMSLTWVLIWALLFPIPLYLWSLSYIVRGNKPFFDKEDGLAKGIANVVTFPISIPVWCVCKIKEKCSKRSGEKKPVDEEKEKDDLKEPTKAKEEEINQQKLENERKQFIPQEPIKSGEGIEMNYNR